MPKTKFPKTTTPDALQVVNRPVAELRPDPRNPRKHTRRQVQQIANSISTFGYNVPILVDQDGVVVAGHGRLAACQLLGWTHVPTISVAHLSADQKRALMIADNRLTDSSSWDDTLLAEIFVDLSNADLDFSLESTGFDMGEIDWRIAKLSDEPDTDADDEADKVPKLQKAAVSQMGDVWQLGRHRVICADATDPTVLDALLEGERARMLFIDPPYNVPIQGHVSGLGVLQHREFAMASGEMSQAQFARFLEQSFGAAAARLVDGGMAFTCIDWRHVADVMAAMASVGGELKNLCVWAKHNPGMGSLYRSAHELIVVTKHGPAPHVNNVALGRFGRNRTNLWRYPGGNSPAMRRGKEGDLLALHPTPKPVAMVQDAILDCSNRSDLVLDTFLGSGTTLIAAERAGRRCFGAEIDPLYVDTTIRRFQNLTRISARLASTGELFNERAASTASSNGDVS